MEARLQAVSSRNMYSEQGLLALMRPSAGQVCHSLMVVSYWRPGSALVQAAIADSIPRSVAAMVSVTFPSIPRFEIPVLVPLSAWKKLFGTRTELLEFWPETVM